MKIEFHVPCVPVAQPRQSHRIVKPANAAPWIQNYVPDKHPVHDFKAQIRLAIAQVYTGTPIQGPIVLRVLALLPRPQRLLTKKSPAGRIPHTIKPDSDNLIKAVKDSLKGLAWTDDCQVYDEQLVKKYVAMNEQAGCICQITSVQDGEQLELFS